MKTKVWLLALTCIAGLSFLNSCEKAEDPISTDDEITENSGTHESEDDYVWDSGSEVSITLNGTSITSGSAGATVSGNKVTITTAGNYSISGTLTDGQVIVSTKDTETVRLILNSANITNSTGAPVYIAEAKKVVVVLPDNSESYLTDSKTYVAANAEDESNATLFSMADLTLYGNGSLTVAGNYLDGITSKDGLIIRNSTVKVTAVDDGIRGKDYLVAVNANLTVVSGGDGIKSDNEDDTDKGYISIESGIYKITAGGDGIAAQTDVIITNGEFNLVTGGGSSKTVASTASAKAIKGVAIVIIEDGNFAINSADDALHTNGQMAVNGGTFTISTADDGAHADVTLEINGGNMKIAKCYEGLESAAITIKDGIVSLTSSDDGVNAADGTTSGGMGGPGSSSGSSNLTINGGYLVVHAAGDGLDVNGSVTMAGGKVFVDGPTANDNGALDYDGTFKISGGFLLAAGSSGMAMAPSTSSGQNSLLMNLTSTQKAGTIVHIQSSTGTELFTYAPPKNFQSVAYSSPDLVKGSTYDVYIGGTSTGTYSDGLYQDGVYTAGTKYASFTVSSVVTKLGAR